MSAATILTILSIVSALFGVLKDAPAVIEEIKSLLAKVSPYVDGANAVVKQDFEAARAKLAALSPPLTLPDGTVLVDAAEGRELSHHPV